MGFSVWVDWRVLGGVLFDVMSWVVCVSVCGVDVDVVGAERGWRAG